MVVKFTTYVISAYRHWCYEFESRSRRGVQQYVIKFVNDLRQVGCFLNDLWQVGDFLNDLRQVGDFLLFTLPSNKTDSHDITEILLKVALNIIKQTNKQTNIEYLKSDHL